MLPGKKSKRSVNLLLTLLNSVFMYSSQNGHLQELEHHSVHMIEGTAMVAWQLWPSILLGIEIWLQQVAVFFQASYFFPS